MADLFAILTQPARVVAPALIGWTLTHHAPDGVVTIELTEVEAYAGQADPASHAWRGRTARNAVMFGPAGRLYVYLSHGLHYCANVVTGPDGEASAVLLRAGRVVEGVDLAQRRRGERVALRSLARGPGCVGQALALTRQHNGANLLDSGPLVLRPPTGSPTAVSSGPRVGVSRAHDWPWRYWLTGDPTVSAYRRGRLASEPAAWVSPGSALPDLATRGGGVTRRRGQSAGWSEPRSTAPASSRSPRSPAAGDT